MIPKIIHLCWLSGDPYPTKIKRCIESWKKYLPDYEIMLWDTKRFQLENSNWVKEAFEKKKYAFAADYIRFYALYNYGGIYLDSDVEVLKSFNNLLDLPYFIGAEKAGTIEAAVLGAEKECNWVKTCLDYYENRKFIKEDGSLDIRKLPEIMDEEIQKKTKIHNLTLREIENIHRFDFRSEVIVFPDDFFSPKVFDSRKILVTKNTYSIHHYQDSWFSPKAKIYYRTRALAIRLLSYKLVCSIERILFPHRF